jgi:hypothetical protein
MALLRLTKLGLQMWHGKSRARWRSADAEEITRTRLPTDVLPLRSVKGIGHHGQHLADRAFKRRRHHAANLSHDERGA